MALLAGTVALPAWPAECRTPLGTPCFTVTFEQSMWALSRSPIRDFVKAEAEGTMALRGDGSLALRIETKDRFAVRDRADAGPAFLLLFLAPEGRLERFHPPQRDDFRRAGLVWTDRPARRRAPDDTACAGAAREFDAQMKPAGSATRLGLGVTRWTVKHSYREIEIEIAPELDCQVIAYRHAEFRYRYLPVRGETFDVRAVRLGEPDARLFAAPPAAGK